MKAVRTAIMILAFLAVSLFGTALYAQVVEDGYNVKEETIEKNGRQIDVLASEDGYVRITQPAKINMYTFEGKVYLVGETKAGTKINIFVYNAKASEYSGTATETYELKPVGASGTFSQVLEFPEGSNKIVLHYLNEDSNIENKMVFYINRESQETQDALSSYITMPGK